MRALAAYGTDPAAQKAVGELVMKGEDFFRSGVIEAVGDYKGAYAFASLNEIAKLDGPLQDDAVIALGKIGDKRALATLANLQRTGPKNMQPMVAAAICLLGVNCPSIRATWSRRSSSRSRTTDSRSCCAAPLRSRITGRNRNEEALSTLLEMGGPTMIPHARRSRSPSAPWRCAIHR